MDLLVIGAGMMGSAAAYDMARCPTVKSVTLADADLRRARDAAARVNKLAGNKKVRAVLLDASNPKKAGKLMHGHAAALSAVPYFFNLGLARAAVDADCHFADLGGNNTVVRKELQLSRRAEKRGVAIAPDCGLSPGLASILAGELMRRIGGRAAALKIYVGGLPAYPKPPFEYQLVFSVEGLFNEYVEPAKVLRGGKIRDIEPLTEPEPFHIGGFREMVAFQTSGGTSTLPETFAGRVGECFEKTLRYPGHYAMVRSLYDLGLFSSQPTKIGTAKISPRALMSKIFEDKFASNEPDVCILRVEAHRAGPASRLDSGGRRLPSRYQSACKPRMLAFTVVDRYDPATGMTAMMRTTAWPASIVTQMLASGAIAKRGGILQERDVPADLFLHELKHRGVVLKYTEER